MPHHPSPSSLTIVPLKIADALLAAGIAQAGPLYLVYDQRSQRFQLVWWERLHWHCTCTKAKCAHVQAVSILLLDESRTRQTPDNDLIAHIEDDLG